MKNDGQSLDEEEFKVEDIKDKKNAKIFNKEELELKNDLSKLNDDIYLRNYLQANQNDQLKEGTGKNLLDNNVVLIRPQILPSTKQIQYQNQLNGDPNNYFYLLIKQLNKVNHGKFDEKDVMEKIKVYEKYIGELHLQKFREKLFLAEQRDIKKETVILPKNTLNLSDQKSLTEDTISDDSYYQPKPRKLTIYDKIWNLCCRSPLKPYSAKKRIWAGENGIFLKQFQDNRDYY